MMFECHLNVIMQGKILRKMLHKVLRKMRDENLRKFFLKESCGTSIAINSQLGFALSEQCFPKKLRSDTFRLKVHL